VRAAIRRARTRATRRPPSSAASCNCSPSAGRISPRCSSQKAMTDSAFMGLLARIWPAPKVVTLTADPSVSVAA